MTKVEERPMQSPFRLPFISSLASELHVQYLLGVAVPMCFKIGYISMTTFQ